MPFRRLIGLEVSHDVEPQNSGVINKFFAVLAYLAVKYRYFKRSVKSAIIISIHEKQRC